MSAAGSPAPAGPVLVAAKLHVPALRAGLVSRGELVGRLADAGERKLVLVCAPAGWGKTSVLSQWHAAEPGAFAWVSLDPGDDDRVRFWSYVIGALRTVAPQVGEAALAALPNAAGDLADAVLPSLLNELAAAGRRLVLVLDDYHCVRNESIHASVAFLLRHLPPNVQLAIATRADPPLPLASLRAAGEILEIRAAQLRFSDAEAGALLNGSLALGLEPADVALLRERTEGWPAGLRLAALSLRDQDDPKAFVASFAGDDRQIAEYLHEFVAAQPRQLREFLLRTSVLERLCASVCDAVTGRSDGVARLEEISAGEPVLGLSRQPWPVVPLPPFVPRSAAPGADAFRAWAGCRAAPARLRVAPRAGRCRRGDRARDGGGRFRCGVRSDRPSLASAL